MTRLRLETESVIIPLASHSLKGHDLSTGGGDDEVRVCVCIHLCAFLFLCALIGLENPRLCTGLGTSVDVCGNWAGKNSPAQEIIQVNLFDLSLAMSISKKRCVCTAIPKIRMQCSHSTQAY